MRREGNAFFLATITISLAMHQFSIYTLCIVSLLQEYYTNSFTLCIAISCTNSTNNIKIPPPVQPVAENLN